MIFVDAKLMKGSFEWALYNMRAGYKVCRKGWLDGEFWKMDKAGRVRNALGVQIIASEEALSADDWQKDNPKHRRNQ